MKREEILSNLSENHRAFIEYTQSLTENEFMFSLNGEKWTAGQEMVHITKSVNMLSDGLRVPKFIIRPKFGVANRPSRTYDGLVDKYHKGLEKLAGSYRAKIDPVTLNNRATLVERLEKSVVLLCHRAKKYSEANLDHYILPHPLLGKLTMRELLYFTSYHVLHHKENSVRNLREFQSS